MSAASCSGDTGRRLFPAPLAAPGPVGHEHPLPLFLQASLAESCSPTAEQCQVLRALKLIYVNGWWPCNAQWTGFLWTGKYVVLKRVGLFSGFFLLSYFPLQYPLEKWDKNSKKNFAFLNSYFYVDTSDNDEKNGAERMEKACPNQCFTTFCRKYLENVKMLYLCQHFLLKKILTF